jgi:1,4-alpha-glucan branching enzyme
MKKASLVVCAGFVVALCAVFSACGSRMPGVPGSAEGVYPEAGPKVGPEGVRFVLFSPKAKKVNIVGDFNNWSTVADPLFDREGNGIWSITLPLKPGSHEYKFLVDGEHWIPDPGNEKKVKDGYGAYNSVVVVGQ